MHVLVTGHTGFKGAWLCHMLLSRGHQVSGLALDPEPGSLFDRSDLGSRLEHDVRCDIRDGEATVAAIADISADAVVHMAAQPLVRTSYVQPRWTLETNVMGTLSVLEGVSASDTVQAALMVTTDKVYRNIGQRAGYVEDDPLGGHDPYSASKAMADVLVSSWTASFPGCPVAVARAGNVIGGGDVSADRLLPDLVRAFAAGRPATLRYPDAVRPWQHVLDCLSGYLLLLDALLAGGGTGAWNFGPDPDSFRTVGQAADVAARAWGPGASWTTDPAEHPHEATLLTLDATRARRELGWHDRLDFEAAIDWTIEWERQVADGKHARDITVDQIAAHAALAGRVE